MRKIYISMIFVIAALLMIISFLSCSKNHEDIAGPSIFFKQPVPNDTLQIIDDSITIIVEGVNNNYLESMNMTLITESGVTLPRYDNYGIDSQDYTCEEKFYLGGITKVTRMRLIVEFENVYYNKNEEEIDFYVKP
jgi:hypothetical protein